MGFGPWSARDEGPVLGAAIEAGSTIRRQPVLLVAAAALAILRSTTVVGQYVNQLVVILLAVPLFFVTPFFLAGLLGSADDALHGGTTATGWLGWGKRRYLALLGATLAQGAIIMGIALTLSVVVLALGIGLVAVASGGLTTVTTLLLVGILLVYAVTILLFAILTVVYKASAVVGDNGPIDALKESYRLTRPNLLSAFAFLVFRGLITFGFAVVAVLGLMLVTGWGLSSVSVVAMEATPVTVAIAFAVVYPVQLVADAFLSTYTVAYYHFLRDGRRSDRGESTERSSMAD